MENQGDQQIYVSSAVLDVTLAAMAPRMWQIPRDCDFVGSASLVSHVALFARKDKKRQSSASDRQRFLNAKRRY